MALISRAARPSGNIRRSSRIVVEPRISRPTSSNAATPDARSPGIVRRAASTIYERPANAKTRSSAGSMRTAFRGSW